MNILISIEHPAWAHQFRHIIKELQRQDHTVTVLAVDKDNDLLLLDSFGIPYQKVAGSTGKNIFEKGFLFLYLSLIYTYYALKTKTDILIGRASPMMAIAAFLSRKRHIIYEDTEVSKFSLRFCTLFSFKIITPANFLVPLGEKQVPVDTYKELFYLHPQYFTPSSVCLRKHEINPDEKYIVMRLISWDASHDFSLSGMSEKLCISYVNTLKKYGKVYISSEFPLWDSVAEHQLSLPPEELHNLLFYATLCISEGATVAAESAVLGTHAIYMNRIQSGTTQDIEKRYQLLYPFNGGPVFYEEALYLAEQLLLQKNFRALGKEKRKKLLQDKIDINQYYLNLIK